MVGIFMKCGTERGKEENFPKSEGRHGGVVGVGKRDRAGAWDVMRGSSG